MAEEAEVAGQAAEGQETGASGAAEGAAPAGKTYSQEEVSKLVSTRVNELNAKWERFGKPEDVERRLQQAEKLEQWANGIRQQMAQAGAVPGQRAQADGKESLSEEDKKVQAYLERIYPGIGNALTLQQRMSQELVGFRVQQFATTNREVLKGLAEAAGGYGPEHLEGLEQHIANSIRSNPQDWQAYLQTGDPAIVKRHFEAVDKWAKGLAPKPPAVDAGKAAAAAKTKVKTTQLPPRMPPAGVPAPTSGTKKLSDKERIDAAFNLYKGQAA